VTNSSQVKISNSYFSSANTRDGGNDPVFQRCVPGNVNIGAVHFTPETLFKIGKKLKSKTSSDKDVFCYHLLKQILPVIASPLCLMYESFMSVGRVPDGWGTAVITPLFKKGASTLPSNYFRPISLNSISSKLMERVIALDVINYPKSTDSLPKHGFLARRSTNSNLLESLNDWTSSAENTQHQPVAYVDFAKAFERVSHNKLLLKLSRYGICGTLLEWIRNFFYPDVCARL